MIRRTHIAVSADGNTVYAAGFQTGNQTTCVSEGMVCDGFGTGQCAGDGITSPNGLPGGNLPGGNPGPSVNHQGTTAPEVGLVVRYNKTTNMWEDELGRNWSNGVRFTLPDEDVFAIDASTLNQIAFHVSVGTVPLVSSCWNFVYHTLKRLCPAIFLPVP